MANEYSEGYFPERLIKDELAVAVVEADERVTASQRSDTVTSSPRQRDSSRRNFLKTIILASGAAAVGGKGAFEAAKMDQGIMGDSLRIIFDRKPVVPRENWYIPETTDNMLSKESTDDLFDRLELGTRYPDTLNKKAFNTVSQRIANLANLFFSVDNNLPKSEQQQQFTEHCFHFMKRMQKIGDEMKVDFVGQLLTWQVSGANTSTPKAQEEDIRDERIRSTSRLLNAALERNISEIGLVEALRLVDLNYYYGMARLAGPVTFNMHDIEIYYYAKALEGLEQTVPEYWPQMQQILSEQSPEFYKRYHDYARLRDNFEQHSSDVVAEVTTDQEIQDFLHLIKNEAFVRTLIGNPEGTNADSFQLTRTTTYWATVSDQQSRVLASGVVLDADVVEKEAFEMTIKSYLDENTPAASIYFDQSDNPRMQLFLERMSQKGSKPASRLLEMSRKLGEESNKLLDADRDIASALIQDNVESNLELQMHLGVAYGRWLLNEAQRQIKGEYSSELKYSDPNEVAFHSFVATLHRETGPSYMQAGDRPLHTGSLPFMEPDKLYGLVDDFIQTVYMRHQDKHPLDQFIPFAQGLCQINLEAYISRIVAGIHLYDVFGQTKMRRLVQQADEWGVYRKLITPPHCSPTRAITDATLGYITHMHQDEEKSGYW